MSVLVKVQFEEAGAAEESLEDSLTEELSADEDSSLLCSEEASWLEDWLSEEAASLEDALSEEEISLEEAELEDSAWLEDSSLEELRAGEEDSLEAKGLEDEAGASPPQDARASAAKARINTFCFMG